MNHWYPDVYTGYGRGRFGDPDVKDPDVNRGKSLYAYLKKAVEEKLDPYVKGSINYDLNYGTGGMTVTPIETRVLDAQKEDHEDPEAQQRVRDKASELTNRVLNSINGTYPSTSEDIMRANAPVPTKGVMINDEPNPLAEMAGIGGQTPTQEPAPTQPTPASNPGQQRADDATFQGLESERKKAEEEKKKALQEAVDAQHAREQQLQDWYGQTPENDQRYMNAPYFRTAQEREYAVGLTQLKSVYDNAEEIAKAYGYRPDQVQRWASEQASLLREQAAAAGIKNLEGYGNGVTLHDALRYIQSNDERARADALNRYADSSSDVYDQIYREQILKGKDPYVARAVAENQARAYQKNRLNFQRDMFHTYGLENGYTNDWATQILAQMAEENPALANYYTNLHGTPKELLGRAEKLQDEASKNAFELVKQGNAAEANLLQEALKNKNLLQRMGVEFGLRDANDARHQEREAGYKSQEQIREAQIKQQGKIDAFKSKVQYIQKLRDAGEIDDTQANAMIAQAYEFTDVSSIFGIGKGKSGDRAEARRLALKDYSDLLKVMIENLRKREKNLRDQIGQYGTPTPEQQEQLDGLNAKLAEADAELEGVLGQLKEHLTGTEPPPFSPDDVKRTITNINDFVAQSRKANYTDDQIKTALIKELKKSGFTDDAIANIVNQYFQNGVGEALQEGIHGR